MSYHICSYYGCKSSSEMKSMFRFPWNDLNRLKIWLENCGNMTITHLPPERLRSKYICIDHFNKEYLTNENGRRKRIKKIAIPEPYRDLKPIDSSSTCETNHNIDVPELKVFAHEKVYVNNNRHINNENCESPGDEPEDVKGEILIPPQKMNRKEKNKDNNSIEFKNLQRSLYNCLKKLRRLVNKDKSIKKKFANRTLIDLSKQRFKSESSKIMTLMQLRVSQRKKKLWTNKEREFCMSLYHKSPSTYKLLYKSGIVLASLSTVHLWFQKSKCVPGINDFTFVDVEEETNTTNKT